MYFFTIIILCCLALPIFSRPTQVWEDYDKEAKEDSYEDSYKPDFDDYPQSEQKSLVKQDDSVDPRRLLEKDYLENNNNDQEESAQLTHNDLSSTNNDIKRTAENNKDNILLQSYEKPSVVQNSEYNEDEVEGPSGLYYRKQKMKEIRDADTILGLKGFDNKHPNIDRGRREINKSDLNDSVGGDEISTQKNEFNANEDDETAIKRHIKKLSKEELDELIHSLSDDKRILLKHIIGSSELELENINKREITKKAGANEENSFVGNEQSDTSKVQGGSDIEAESAVPNTEKLENTKKSEGETICSKNTEIVNTSEKSIDKVNVLDDTQDLKVETNDKVNLDSSQTQAKIQTGIDTEHEPSKNENKREIKLKPIISKIKNEVSKSDDDLYCSENDDLSRLWNEESKLYGSNDVSKREVSAYNQKSIKSLEESFPNSEDTSNLKSGSNMVPLIRVKRKNDDKILEKREANELSNLQVPFHSNTVNDNGEDSEVDDEGSEFEDEGLFDKRSNFAVSGELKKQDSESPNAEEDNMKNCNRNTQQHYKNSNNLESDIVSLGSDSDTVLSGIEGVDDNIMYNSVSRNRRTPAEFNNVNNNDNSDNLIQKNMSKLVTANDDIEISEQNNNGLQYQENDAFGSLPRNYEGDLGRFKRIRRLKQLRNQENNDSVSK